jgi:hypothetical protein
MRTRCENPKATQFKWYGGKGVTVCDRWKSFELFIADVGERPSIKHTLDRYPNTSGNYEPDNVRWATHTQQCRNRVSSKAVVRSDGVSFPTMAEAADAVGGKLREIWSVCNGKRRSHRGYGWRYA